ncbi:MAG: hypothetical protein ACR2PH_04845, partial [Desulfobulbia bacterium]
LLMARLFGMLLLFFSCAQSIACSIDKNYVRENLASLISESDAVFLGSVSEIISRSGEYEIFVESGIRPERSKWISDVISVEVLEGFKLDRSLYLVETAGVCGTEYTEGLERVFFLEFNDSNVFQELVAAEATIELLESIRHHVKAAP